MIKIFADYQPLLNKAEADEVWILAEKECAATAKNFIAATPQLKFQTFQQLQHSIINFTTLLGMAVQEFEASELFENYESAYDTGGKDIIKSLKSWIVDVKATSPVAVLAGYGKGKTSLAKKLVHDLAAIALQNPLARIPVYVPLADIANEQSLEGLLGKLMTISNKVTGYSYPLFNVLNESGKFVVVLDGFDEMKHSITFEQFSYNFQELNRLSKGRSKVIVLGRPSAFLSEDEQNFVFRGETKVGGQIHRKPGAPLYQEIEIANLNLEQAYRLVERYALYYRSKSTVPVDDVTLRMNELRSYGIDDIVTRPVHAKMIASLVSDESVQIRKFSPYDIFDLFIKQTIDREVREKSVRKAFSTVDRRRFERRVAWTVWRFSNKQYIDANKIPDSVFNGIISPQSLDTEADKRDLIQACFLERKAGSLYFPHRSFQEFLVSEYLLEEQISTSDIRYISENVNREILLFFSGNPQRQKINSQDIQLSNFTGTLSFELFKALAIARNLKAGIYGFDRAKTSLVTPWTILLNTLCFIFSRPDDVMPGEILKYLTDCAGSTSSSFNRLAALLSLTFLTGLPAKNDSELAAVWFAACIFERVSFAKFSINIIETRRNGRKYNGFDPAGAHDLEEAVVAKYFSFNHRGEEPQIEIQVLTSQLTILSTLEQRYKVTNIDLMKITPKIVISANLVSDALKLLNPKLLPAFKEFLSLKSEKI